jgi:hypothetical protein
LCKFDLDEVRAGKEKLGGKMFFKVLLGLYALNNLGVGIGALFVPNKMMANSNLNPMGMSIFQGLGAFAVALGLLAVQAIWLKDAASLRAVSLTIVIATGLTAIVNALAIRAGARPSGEWAFVGIDVVFALVFAYFRFFKL